MSKEVIHNSPKVLVILGPTASGKSELAVKIAKQFNGEIISADSRQVYCGMDIGTAKPKLATSNKRQGTRTISPATYRMSLKGIPHYLIDIKNPNEPYTVADYKRDAIRAIKKILQKGKLPILVGGTGLYIKAVIDNLEIPRIKPNPLLRQKLERELKARGLNYLYEKLIKLDPEAVYILDNYNPRRVIRALEITLGSGKPFSSQRKAGTKIFNALKIGLHLPREKLKEQIYKRADKMIEVGLVNETEQLIKKYSPELPVFDAIGYREIIQYLQNKISLTEAINLIKKNTWHYAKRQMTWFRKDKEINWINNLSEVEKSIKSFLKK